MGVCVPNVRSVSFFVWPGGVTQINTYINKYTHIQVKLGISSTGCSPHVDFEKACLDMVQESVCTKCQVCIVFRVARRRNTDTHAHRHTSIQVKIRISPTVCSPPVDFDKAIEDYMRKIHVTRQFFQASGPRDIFFKKKTSFQIWSRGCVYTKFQVFIEFRLDRRLRTDTPTHKPT